VIDARLEDGWQPDTPEGDTLLHAYVRGFTGWLADLGHRLGVRTLVDEDVVAMDTGSGFFLANGAMLRRPCADVRALGARLTDFYAAEPGGPWALFSPFALRDPDVPGLDLAGHPPFMVRPAGGDAPVDPEGLVIEEARDAAALADFAAALSGYPAPDADVFARPGLLEAPGTRIFVGYSDGRPVACAAAHVTDPCVHVEWVAAHEDVRGRGFGAAVTWRATLADPSKPAVLLASDSGQPVYARMGYLRLSRFTCWTGTR
jgi:hypothetical protein